MMQDKYGRAIVQDGDTYTVGDGGLVVTVAGGYMRALEIIEAMAPEGWGEQPVGADGSVAVAPSSG